MSEELRELADQIGSWAAPPNDLGRVLSKGRKLRRARYLGGSGLLVILLVGGVLGYRVLGEVGPDAPAAGTTFDWVEEVARQNGVLVEHTEPDETWKHAPEEVRDPDGDLRAPFESDPVAVLVTSPTLDRGLDRERAWATFIDGDAPGPIGADDGSGGTQRVLLTLLLDKGGTVFLPAAPPYEDWDAVEVEDDRSSEPSGLWVTHDWEGTEIEHPSNWRRSERVSGPGGSGTVLTLTNMSELPHKGSGTIRTGYDMSGAPSDAIVVEITKSEGGPMPGLSNRPLDTEGREEGGFKLRIGDEMVSVWFHVGPDASGAQRAAADRMLRSLDEAQPDPRFRRYTFTLGEERWVGTLEVSSDARSACITLSASFDEVHLHRIGDARPVTTWFSGIGSGGEYCLRNVAETTIESLMFGPEGYEVEVHGGQLDDDRSPLEELGAVEYEPRVSMAFGRLPDVEVPPCPSGDFSAAVSDEEARDLAERIMEASNGPEADPQVLWQLLDSSLRASIGDFRTLRRLMRETDVAEKYGIWEVADRVDRGVGSVEVCENVPSGSVSMPSVFFPTAEGVSGAAVQLYLVARSSGPKLWFIY